MSVSSSDSRGLLIASGHGTGTKIGDPIEAGAVARIFGDHGIYIGSVKPNLGHSEGASGLSSVIKMVLALENRTIPPNILFCTPNPKIPFEEAKLTVPIKPMPWPSNKLERVGVNSFGIGGSNAHVLLESASSFGIGPAATGQMHKSDVNPGKQPHLLVFSAKHPSALTKNVESHERYLKMHPGSVRDMAFSLATKREAMPHRQYCVTDGDALFELSRSTKISGQTPADLIFVFTGQGAQWAQMGETLLDASPVFRDTIARLDAILSTLPDAPGWTLLEEIRKPVPYSRLSEAEYSQACCTAVQVALVDVLVHCKIKPQGVVGHSSGEIAAAYASGAISAADAITIAYYRGSLLQNVSNQTPGGMAAVGLGRQEVSPFLKPGIIVGCENSPESVTLSGDSDVLECVMERIRAAYPQVFMRRLRVDRAYHSSEKVFSYA